jgi:hydrogenase maturation protease
MTPVARESRPLARNVPQPSGNYRWIYLWGWPIRAMHWAAAASIVVLVVTGFYIGAPYFVTSGEASAHFLMGWMRFLHFAAAGVFVATAIVRVYWLFAGNQFERWRALFPVKRKDWVNFFKQLKFYLLIKPEQGPHYLGHNPCNSQLHRALRARRCKWLPVRRCTANLARRSVVPAVGCRPVPRRIRLHFVHHVFTDLFDAIPDPHLSRAARADLLSAPARSSRSSAAAASARTWTISTLTPRRGSTRESADGDDGLGPVVLAELRSRYVLPEAVELVDGGTWGMNLLPIIEDADDLILIDAIEADQPAGTFVRIKADRLPRYLATKISAHQIDLRDVLGLAEFRGTLPPSTVALGLQPESVELRNSLSEPLQCRVAALADEVVLELAKHGHPLQQTLVVAATHA